MFPMKSLITTTLVGAFISASAAAATGWQTDFEAVSKLASKEKKDLLLDLTGSDWKQGFLYDRPGRALFFLITQDEGQEPKKKKAVEQGKKEDKGPDEGTLRKALAKTRKQVEIVQKKIEGDHALWTRSGEQMKESRERLAELETSLARERLQFDKLRQSIARIEREHNDDHDREEALAAELAGREKALADFESKQDEITKLEKKAAELRRQAGELRKRAEELREK